MTIRCLLLRRCCGGRMMPGTLRRAVCAVLFLALATAARADALDDVRTRGTIRWGGDKEGGGPYIFPRQDDPRQVAGFEVELMDLLAARMGVSAEFRQCEWTNLPDLLRKGDIDVIVNGYERTRARRASMLATLPYYIYELQLIARRDDPSIRSWDDLKRADNRRKPRIGVLLGSGADTYVRE